VKTLSARHGSSLALDQVTLRPACKRCRWAGHKTAINKQPLGAAEVETRYAVELRCQGQEEAQIRALLLQAAASAGLGLRRLTSENLEDSPQVTVSALLVSARRNDAALEQIIGRMSLEPFVTAAHWQAQQAAVRSDQFFSGFETLIDRLRWFRQIR